MFEGQEYYCQRVKNIQSARVTWQRQVHLTCKFFCEWLLWNYAVGYLSGSRNSQVLTTTKVKSRMDSFIISELIIPSYFKSICSQTECKENW